MRNTMPIYIAMSMALLLLIFPLASIASETLDKSYWYEVTTKHGKTRFEFYGSSKYKSDEFIKRLIEDKFIRLDNLMFRKTTENATQYIDWKDWDPLKKEHIYLNSDYVIAVHPLESAPNKK